jgi:hypothetical protein
MKNRADSTFYTSQTTTLLKKFDEDARYWITVMTGLHGHDTAEELVADARQVFEDLIPELPYIGGQENHLTNSLIWSAQCLALYQVFRARGMTAAAVGKILYDAIHLKASRPRQAIPSSEWLTPEDLMARRRERAERSQQREFSGDWVFTFVEGDGDAFDYGYDFTECATQKFFQAHDAEDFLPYYCFLDYAYSEIDGLGLSRSKTLAEGETLCDHRFKQGRVTDRRWPPPFLKSEK